MSYEGMHFKLKKNRSLEKKKTADETKEANTVANQAADKLKALSTRRIRSDKLNALPTRMIKSK